MSSQDLAIAPVHLISGASGGVGSQNGWLVDSAQLHQAYLFPFSNAIVAGCLLSVFGTSDILTIPKI